MHTNSERKRVTDNLLRQLHKLKAEANIGSVALLKKVSGTPDGLNAKTIDNLLSGKISTIRLDYLNFILSAYKSLTKQEYIIISEEQRQLLCFYQEKSGLKPQALLKGAGTEIPVGLNSTIIKKWLKEPGITARKDHFKFVLIKWGETLQSTARTRIDSRLRSEIIARFKVLQISPEAFMRNTKNIPPGLNAPLIRSWILGKTKSARKDHINFVLNSIPVGSFMSLDEEKLETIRCLKNKSNISVRLLAQMKDLPNGLDERRINLILGGRVQKIKKDHYQGLLELLESFAAKSNI